MCMKVNNDEIRKNHESLVKHLGDSASCTQCSNTCGCFRLKQTLSYLGEKVFLEKAIGGKLPPGVQELYDKKLSAMAEKRTPQMFSHWLSVSSF